MGGHLCLSGALVVCLWNTVLLSTDRKWDSGDPAVIRPSPCPPDAPVILTGHPHVVDTSRRGFGGGGCVGAGEKEPEGEPQDFLARAVLGSERGKERKAVCPSLAPGSTKLPSAEA